MHDILMHAPFSSWGSRSCRPVLWTATADAILEEFSPLFTYFWHTMPPTQRG